MWPADFTAYLRHNFFFFGFVLKNWFFYFWIPLKWRREGHAGMNYQIIFRYWTTSLYVIIHCLMQLYVFSNFNPFFSYIQKIYRIVIYEKKKKKYSLQLPFSFEYEYEYSEKTISNIQFYIFSCFWAILELSGDCLRNGFLWVFTVDFCNYFVNRKKIEVRVFFYFFTIYTTFKLDSSYMNTYCTVYIPGKQCMYIS